MKPAFSFTRKYMMPYAVWYIAGFFLVMGTQAVMVAIVEETKAALDAQELVLKDYPHQGKIKEPEASPGIAKLQERSIILPYVKKILALGMLLFLVRVLSRYLVFTPGRMIEFTIRNDLFQTLLHKPRSFFRRFETGDLISRASNDIGFIRAAYGYGVLQVVNVFSAFSFGIWAMWRMDPETTLWIGLPMFSTLILIQLTIRYLFKYWRRANEQLGALSSFCLGSFQGISAVQGYHAEPQFIARFQQKSETYLQTNLLITKMRSFVMPLVSFSGSIATFIVLWIIGAGVIEGQRTIGQISAFFGYIAMVMPPLLSLGWMLNVFNRAVPAIERLQEILNREEETCDKGPVQVNTHPVLAVKDLNLSFQTKENQFKLSHINFELPPGKSLGIVGEVGAGKTALVEALLRFNPTDSGEIWLGDLESSKISLKSFRNFFSFAPQRAFLFSTSLRDNLTQGLDTPDRHYSDPELKEVLDLAGFSLDPTQFPKGLDTQVGEKGIMLSGGQRQRIALARCFLKTASFYILDDVLSAVDQDTQRVILSNLKNLSKSQSYLIVSHRISAVQWCDEILVLENGKIVDRGTHQELLQRPGYYLSSFQYQTNGDS